MSRAPTYRWTLKDHALNRLLAQGEAPTADKAKAALVTAVRAVGGWKPRYSGGVTRPSGGGWFARRPERRADPIDWEEWEPEVV